jgi:hypothetical protein
MVNRDLERMRNQYELEAMSAGLEYLGGADAEFPPAYRKYRKVCGHIANMLPSHVRVYKGACKICISEKLEREAEKEGLTIIEKVFSKRYLYQLPCGHSQEIYTSAVRTGEWICNKCNLTHFDSPSVLYLFEIVASDGFSWLKLGYSGNTPLRICRYGLVDCELSIIFMLPFQTGRDVIKYEKKLHTQLLKDRLDPTVMKQYHTRDGYTECYPIQLKQTILELVNERLENENHR